MAVGYLQLGFSLFSLICGTSTAFPPDKDLCFFWDQAIYSRGYCFTMFHPGWLSQKDAEEECEEHTSGGQLAEILDLKQLEDLQNFVVSNGLTSWLGPEYDKDKQTFVNPSGSTSISGLLQNFWELGHVIESCDPCLAMTSAGHFITQKCSDEHILAYTCQQKVDNACDLLLPGSQYFRGHCFLYMAQPLTWNTAKDTCLTMNSQLVELTTPDITKFVQDMGQQYPGSEWMGACDSGDGISTLHWWRSGIPVSLESQYWGFHHSPNLEKNRCLLQDETSNNLWRTAEAAELHPFICFVEHGNPCEHMYPNSVYSSGHCYKLYTVPKRWNDAKAVCDQEEAELAELSTNAAFHTVNQLAKTPKSNRIRVKKLEI